MTRAKDISKIVTDADLSGTLDVTGTVTAGGLTLGHQNYIAWADSGGTTRSAFQFDTDTLKIGISGNIDNTIIRSNGADRIKADSNGDISFYEDTGTTPKFFWDASTERLGIGTSSPSAGLHVVATDGIKSQRSGGASISMVAGSTGEARLDTSTAGRVFQVNSNGSISINATTGSGDGDVNIDSSGNVGIGTASPNTALQVEKDWVSDYGSINISHTTNSLGGLGIRCNGVFKSALIYKGGTSGALLDIGTYNAEPILFRTNNTERMRITSGGNIGIGTSSPATPLHISNSSPRITLTDSDAAGINSTISGSSGRLSFNADADNYGTGEILFNQAGTERMRIDSSGNVGIGTNNPSGLAGASVNTVTNGSASYQYVGAVAGTKTFIAYGDVSQNIIGSVTAIPFIFRTSNTERMRIDSSGNVGIGTSSPAPASGSDTTLEIAGSDGPSLTINDTGQAEKYSLLANANDLKIYYGSTPMVSFQNDGNVGIGTANPVYKFIVSAGGASGIEFGPAYSGTANLVQHYSRSGASYVDAVNVAAQHRFNFSGSERMRIDSSGNLLVGVTSTSIPGVGNTTLGVSLRGGSNNSIAVSRGADVAGYFNRNTNNGTILSLRQDGVQIGNIGTPGNQDMFLASGNIGLLISGSGTVDVYPCDNNGSARDNVADFGQVGARWDDIYATNGTIQTSDRNEKQDIEQLSDAEQRVAVVAKGLMRKFRWKDKVAEKGDNARTHFGIIAQDLQDAFTAEGLDAGDYAMFTSTTWWEKEISVDAVQADQENGIEAKDAYIYIDRKNEATEGYTERTRLGVRYNQLLAFIISAI